MTQLITALRQFTSGALDLVFPHSCVHCGREGELLCHTCVSESTSVSKDVCRKCAEPLPKAGTCARCVAERSGLDRLYGSYLYETPIGTAVRAFKFDDLRALGSVLAGRFNVGGLSRADADLIIPIPMHGSRLRARGYNQSEILGRKLARQLGVRFQDGLLSRERNTVPQSVQPTAAARQSAVRGAFSTEANSVDEIVGKRILLVEDVFTTGSTVKWQPKR